MNRIGGTLLTLLLAAGTHAAAAQTTPPAGQRPGVPGAGAQQQAGEIRGVVHDAASGQPLAGASIAVRSARDSSLITGGVTRADGSFRIEGLRPGSYYLRVSRLGYATGTVSRVAVTPAEQTANVGVVRLSAGAVALAGITATTQRATVSSTPDRTVVTTRDMPAVTGGNATDVLRNVPGVDVDGDGKVSLRGNQNVAIQINGRPAPLTGDALTNFLKQLPANLIDRVEVVPNPSAKYDPDGMGGIINIALKQNTDLGTSGGLTVGAGTGNKYNASGNLGRQSGRLTLFGSYGFNHDDRDLTGFSLRDQHFSGVPREFIDQLSDGNFRNTSHTVNGSGDLKLSQHDVLSSTFMLNKRAGNSDSGNGFTFRDDQQQVTSAYQQESLVRQRGLTTDYALSFKRTLQPQRNELSGQVHFNRSRDDTNSGFNTLAGGTPPAGLAPDSRNDVAAVTRQLDWQADYTRQLFSSTRLDAGYKGTLRRLDNDQTVDSVYGGVADLSKRVHDAFSYDENVQAGYALLTETVTKALSLQGGVRAERATTTFNLAGAGYPNDYTSFFPSAAATLQIGQRDQLHFSYSKRINRPQAWQLNPFPFVQDQYDVFVGNPRLKPEYTHSYEASYQKSTPFGSFTVTPFYRHTVNVVRRFASLTPVDTLTFTNLNTADSYGTDANAQLRLGKLSGFVGGSAFQLVTDGSNVQGGLSSNSFTWSLRGSLNLKLSPNTDVQWFQFYRAPTKTEQGRIGAFAMANIAVRQKINEKASLSLRVADPFATMRFNSTTVDPYFSETAERSFNARAVYLSFSYNFGHPPRLRQPPPPDQQPDPGQQPGMPGR